MKPKRWIQKGLCAMLAILLMLSSPAFALAESTVTGNESQAVQETEAAEEPVLTDAEAGTDAEAEEGGELADPFSEAEDVPSEEEPSGEPADNSAREDEVIDVTESPEETDSTKADTEEIWSDGTEELFTDTAESAAYSWSGEGTSSKPYEIGTTEDLLALKEAVNSGQNMAGKYFSLTADLTLPQDWDMIGTLKSGETVPAKGANILPFAGVFDGGSHTITVPEGGLPLFGYVRGATIRNLNIYGTQIAGNGLIQYTVVDYGADGAYNTSDDPAGPTLQNITLKSGTRTLKSGLLGGAASSINKATLTNCRAEAGVVIGYSEQESNIGSLAGEFNGYVYNCSSSATVYGVNHVGGLIGAKGQSMGDCRITDSSFTGSILATGNQVGGIIGSGYDGDGTAPNTPVVTVNNCYVAANISGNDRVGGILGAEPGCEVCWANGRGSVSNNLYYGNLSVASGATKVGGIIGYLKGYDKYQTLDNNYYLDTCGASRAVGEVGQIITTDISSTYGFSETPDLTKAGTAASAADFAGETVKDALNSGKRSSHNWAAGTQYPVFGEGATPRSLSMTGTYKTKYYIGEELDLSEAVFVVNWSDGHYSYPSLNEIEVSGYNPNPTKRGKQEIILRYGAVDAMIDVYVLKKTGTIDVTFSLYGDDVHNSDADGQVHTLARNNLQTWAAAKTYNMEGNSTVLDLLTRVLEENGMTFSNSSGNYVQSITRNGVTLAELTNGSGSGWMYTLNGEYSNLGVAEQYLEDGDVVVFHYTDNYLDTGEEPHVHQYGAWETTAEATVFALQTQKRTCTCGAIETRTVGKKLSPTISVNAKSLVLQVKQSTSKVKVTGLARGDSVKSWKTSNSKIVTVSKNGKIQAKSKTGTAKITITLASGKKAVIKVKVQKSKVKTTKISGLKKTVTVKRKKTLRLAPVLIPITSTDKIYYSTSNKKIATVSSGGVIRGRKAGTAKITVKAGTKRFVLTVKVKK